MGWGIAVGWPRARHPPRMGLSISRPLLNPTRPCPSVPSVMSMTGRNFRSVLPSNHIALEILEFWGHTQSLQGWLSLQNRYDRHISSPTALNHGDYYPCYTGKQQHAPQPDNRGTRPRPVSSKPTLDLDLLAPNPHLEMGSVEKCSELVRLDCNDMFTCLSSVGGSRIFYFSPWIRYYIKIYQVLTRCGGAFNPSTQKTVAGGAL